MFLQHIESAVCTRRSDGSEGADEGGVCCCGGELSERGLCEWVGVGWGAVLGWNMGKVGSGACCRGVGCNVWKGGVSFEEFTVAERLWGYLRALEGVSLWIRWYVDQNSHLYWYVMLILEHFLCSTYMKYPPPPILPNIKIRKPDSSALTLFIPIGLNHHKTKVLNPLFLFPSRPCSAKPPYTSTI